VESVWPVFNVVIENGKLYCSAGRHEEFEGGIHFYCLDAATGTIQWHVKRRRGLESDLAPIRQRKNTGDDRGTERLQRGILSDGRAHLNDTIELRDGQICLHGVPVVDITTPKDVVVYPQTLVPPQLRN
jgi:outer membrane protein assembly factor BamB